MAAFETEKAKGFLEIDINRLMKESPGFVDGATPVTEFREPYIMEVPAMFKSSPEKEKEYVPQLVGLGPYHHNGGSLKNQANHKLEAVRRTLLRISVFKQRCDVPVPEPENPNPDDLQVLRDMMKSKEKEIRACYSAVQEIPFHPDMFVLDGSFVIETMLAAASVMSSFKDVITWKTGNNFFAQRLSPVVWESVCLDFIKLENQIPLFVIRDLMRIQGLEKHLSNLFVGLYTVVSPLPNHFITHEKIRDMLDKNPSSLPDVPDRPGHFLDGLLQFTIAYILSQGIQVVTTIREKHPLPYDQEPQENTNITCAWIKGTPFPSNEKISLPRATELNRAKISVEKGERIEVKEKFFDIFTTLTIPMIFVKEHTSTILQNLISFELCPAVYGNTVTTYVAMLDNLINNDQDVEILKDGGVIDGVYGSEEQLANVFNTISKTMVSDYTGELKTKVIMRIRHLHGQQVRKMLMEFYSQYLSRPWLVVATLAGAIVTVSTVWSAIRA